MAPEFVAALRAECDAVGGSVPFERFMQTALYGPHGFYSTGGRAGRRGDFLTSPEVGPLFGAVLARWIDAVRVDLGDPADFTVVEVGAGPGTLARSVLAALGERAPRYVAVEVSAGQRASHPPVVESVADLPLGPITGVVIANELLDNLPFGLAVFDGGWREARVAVSADDRLVEVLGSLVDPLPRFLPATAPHGARAPLQRATAEWVHAARSLLTAGRVLAIDYCTARTAALAMRPWRDWLRTYRGHERGGHYLADPGGQDVTAEVCLDQLPEPDAVRTQAQFLQRWGIDDLVEEGRREWAAAAAAPSVRVLMMRSRVREAEALLDPAGLGAFTTLEWTSRGGGAERDDRR